MSDTINYVHIPSSTNVPDKIRVHSQEHATWAIGSRVLAGFGMVQRWLEDRNGDTFGLVYFQSEITGKVWAIYW